MWRSLVVVAFFALDTSAQSLVARLNLMSHEGAAAANATWRYSDVRIIEVAATDGFGRPVITNEFEPRAGGRDFDDSSWEILDPTTLGAPRSNGRVSFNWYRVRVTIPESVNGISVSGTAVYFETVVDDYGEVWVDGRLPRDLGQKGGSVVAGFNAPNRVLLTANAVPGQEIQIAIFGINGPISDAPHNFIFLRYADLDFVQFSRRRAIQ